MLFSPQRLLETHAHKSPISGAGHLHDKMLQPQTTSLGSSHTQLTEKKHFKPCAPLITFYFIRMDVQTDAMKNHQPYPWTIGSMQSVASNAIPTL